MLYALLQAATLLPYLQFLLLLLQENKALYSIICKQLQELPFVVVDIFSFSILVRKNVVVLGSHSVAPMWPQLTDVSAAGSNNKLQRLACMLPLLTIVFCGLTLYSCNQLVSYCNNRNGPDSLSALKRR